MSFPPPSPHSALLHFVRLTQTVTCSSCRASAIWNRHMSQDITRHSMTRSPVTPLDIEPSRLTVTKTTSPKELPSSKSLIFGQTFVGHPLVLFVCCASS
ncbi:hypothetical protein BDR05DRAFT_664628 [Suillus weaverae]|nr:hypothetical protein BDR05DRAFT_664628 [Suillus weaverae]